ncbi:MAG: hypothetical protein GC180_13340 [Bacteroidetes bacterium]|nr:hypothetical protein [Bacteroidota bacterium]
MKIFNKVLILTLAVVLAGSCTKLQESPDPGKSTGDTTGSGNTGNADVYIGLWKLTKKTQDGTDVPLTDYGFTVKLDVAATATWTYYLFGVEQAPISDGYTLHTSTTPKTIDFTDAGVRTILNKTGSEIKWTYQDANNNNAVVVETLTKQ